MYDTQKTTKGVREAPAASQSTFDFLATLTVVAQSPEEAKQQANDAISDANEFMDIGCTLSGAIGPYDPDGGGELQAPDQPRYTVELTTEGWQIKDNERDVILVDVFSDRLTAENKAVRWSWQR